MRMRSCPHCGADNSTKRTTCYQCRNPLVQDTEAQRSGPASRWEAIEPVRRGRQPDGAGATPDATSSPAQESPAASRARPRRYVPTVRRSVGHIRRTGLFFRQLHTLTRTGISIAAACREVERRSPGNLRPVARDMAQAAEQGEPISEALEDHRRLFYPWHLGVIRAAEAGGFIPEAFEQIAHAYEVEWETRSALRLRLFVYGALGAPAILLSAPLILTIAQPIPAEGWTPQSVIETVVHYFRTVSLPVAAGLVAIMLLWQMLQAMLWFQTVQQRIVLYLPLVGRVAKTAALDRYLATLGLMLRGGLPIASAAEEASLAAGNPVLTPLLLDLVPGLREGAPLSSLLAETRVFDPDTLNMASTGEVSGSLPDMLTRASGFYREENEAKRRMLLRLAGVVVGVLCLCVYGGLIYLGLRAYFDFAFRTYDWMMEGFE